jgi:flotillin
LNKITGDFAKMAAQVPALFESLSGMNMTELLSKVRGIGDKSPRPDALPPSKGNGK